MIWDLITATMAGWRHDDAAAVSSLGRVRAALPARSARRWARIPATQMRQRLAERQETLTQLAIVERGRVGVYQTLKEQVNATEVHVFWDRRQAERRQRQLPLGVWRRNRRRGNRRRLPPASWAALGLMVTPALERLPAAPVKLADGSNGRRSDAESCHPKFGPMAG
jgi:hypothetical protein